MEDEIDLNCQEVLGGSWLRFTTYGGEALGDIDISQCNQEHYRQAIVLTAQDYRKAKYCLRVPGNEKCECLQYIPYSYNVIGVGYILKTLTLFITWYP